MVLEKWQSACRQGREQGNEAGECSRGGEIRPMGCHKGWAAGMRQASMQLHSQTGADIRDGSSYSDVLIKLSISLQRPTAHGSHVGGLAQVAGAQS